MLQCGMGTYMWYAILSRLRRKGGLNPICIWVMEPLGAFKVISISMHVLVMYVDKKRLDTKD